MLKDIAGNILQLVFNIENQNEIINNIWLGNYKASIDKDFINNNGIEVIFNCTRTHPFIENDNIIKYRLDVNDHSNDLLRMRKRIDWASYTLNHHMKNNKKILIHCHAGLQRSATLLAYTLMRYRNISLKNCVNLIRSRRPMAFPIPFTFYKLLKNAEDRFIKKD